MNFKPEHLGPDWIAKMDYYHVDFKDYVQYFDSLSELKAMLTVEMPMSKRQSQIEMYQRVRFKSLKQWSSVLNITIPAKFIS